MKLTPTEIVCAAVIVLGLAAAVITGYRAAAEDKQPSKAEFLAEVERDNERRGITLAIWDALGDHPCETDLLITRHRSGNWRGTCVRCDQTVPYDWLWFTVDGFNRYSGIVGRTTFRYRDFALWFGWCEDSL